MPWSYPLLVTACSSALLVGFGLTVAWSLSPILHDRLKLTETQVRSLKLAFFLSLVGMLLLGGWLLDQWGVEMVVVLGASLLAGAVTIQGVTQQFRVLLLGILGVGAGTALLYAGCVLLMQRAFPIPSTSAVSAVNVGYAIIGLGGLATPALCRWLTGRWFLRTFFLLLGPLCLIPAAGALLTPDNQFPLVPVEPPARTLALADLVMDLRYWLLLAALVFCYPLEGSLAKWAPQYLQELQFRPHTAEILLVWFWLVLLATRLLFGLFMPSHTIGAWVWVFSLVTAIALGNLVGSYRKVSGAVMLMMIAASFGPTMPTVVGMILDTFPEHTGVSGTAFATICAAGVAFGMLCTPTLTWMTRRWSVRVTLGFLMLQVLLFLAPFLTLLLHRR